MEEDDPSARLAALDKRQNELETALAQIIQGLIQLQDEIINMKDDRTEIIVRLQSLERSGQH